MTAEPMPAAPIDADPIDAATAPLLAILHELRRRLDAGATAVRVRVLDPDHGRGRYAGEVVELDGRAYIHRSFRAWVDLAERLGLRLLTPRPASAPRIELCFERVADPAPAWDHEGAASERYGEASGFSRISRLEDPALVLDVEEALARIDLRGDARVLALGVGRGDELALVRALAPGLGAGASFVGVDHSASALAVARTRFPGPAFTFIEADLAALPGLDLGAFDLAIALGVLQSPAVDDRALLRHLVQSRLGPRGALLLGVPNCRYRGGEVVHGARTRNLREPELSLVIADIAYYRRYLHQHRRRVFVTGKHYLWVTAIPRAAEGEPTSPRRGA